MSEAARAQTSSVSGPAAQLSEEMVRALYADMASDLRNLVIAEEAFFADNSVYGRVLSTTDHRSVYVTPRPGVTLTLTYVTRNSWAGRANHSWLPGRSCVIYAGAVPPSRMPRTAGSGSPAAQEGEPTCDQP